MSSTTHHKDLQDSAASAALKGHEGGSSSSKGKYPLDADNKLSSAGAAASLKTAQPRDLPSFPSTGIANKEASAGAAASLAFAEHKRFEYWKPEQSGPAERAALLAHDSKPPKFWHPEASLAGSKAALLAHKNNTGVNIWHPDPTSEGNSAASLAMRGMGKGGTGVPKSSSAALAGDTRRRRSDSIPVSYTYPDAANSASNALKAATKAHAPKTDTPIYTDLPGFTQEEAARIHKAATTNMKRAMYTSTPPVAPEVEEKNHQAGLRAAAISMARNMMIAQERAAELHKHDGDAAAGTSRGNRASADGDRRQAALQYINLQDAAKKLAAERLAKIHNEDEEYRQYYGAFAPNKSRMSLRSRRRSSSDGQFQASDRARSEKIRSDMSLFTSKLAEVDSKKRQSDRDALLATAQKNVQNSMKSLDEKVFQETGKASPAIKAQWEASARAKAEKDSEARLVNFGKVHIGGGKYMDQSAIDAIAAAKVQPTLDEVTRKAEARRALDEQRRQHAEDQRRTAELKAAEEKDRKRETKNVWQKFKSEEKERKKTEKEHEDAKKIYQATAGEQDRKARAAEQETERLAAEKAERDNASGVERSWAEVKESDRREKGEAKQEKRKSRIGGLFSSIGHSDKDKEDDSGGRVSEDIKSESTKVVVSKTEGPAQATSIRDTTTSTVTNTGPAPAFTDQAVNEAFKKIAKHEEVSPEEALVMPATSEGGLASAEPLYIPTDLKKKESGKISSAVASKTTTTGNVTKVTAGSSSTTTSPATKEKTEDEGSKQSWFKRKFSRGNKDEKPQPGAIGKLKRPQDDSPNPSDGNAKNLKISAPIAIGSTAIATSSDSQPPATHTNTTTAATPSPIHQTSTTTTNHSERDVALAGKQSDQAPPTTLQPSGLLLSSIPEPPSSQSAVPAATQTKSRSRSTSISSLSSTNLRSPSPSTQQNKLLAPQDPLNRIDTARTSGSGDVFVEAKEEIDDNDVVGTATGTTAAAAAGVGGKGEGRNVSSGSGTGARETKFHEEL